MAIAMTITTLMTQIDVSLIDEPFSVTVEAHSGRTDRNGGHKDNKNKSGLGFYHYHCGDSPAHLHSDGVCPYASGGTASVSNTSSDMATSMENAYTDTDTVKMVQQKLNAIGYDCGTPDGIAGNNTMNAIQEFQKDNALSEDGMITDELLQALEKVNKGTTSDDSISESVGVPLDTFIMRYNEMVDLYGVISGENFAYISSEMIISGDDFQPDNDLYFSINPNSNQKDVVGIINAYTENRNSVNPEVAGLELLALTYAFDESLTMDDSASLLEEIIDNAPVTYNNISYTSYSLGDVISLKGQYDGFEIKDDKESDLDETSSSELEETEEVGVINNINTAADIPDKLMNEEFKSAIDLFSKGFSQSGLNISDATTYNNGETYIFYLDNLEFLGDECEEGSNSSPRIIYDQEAINNDGTPSKLFLGFANPLKSNGYEETVEMVEDIADALDISDDGLIDNDYSSSSPFATGEYATFTFKNLNLTLSVRNTDGSVDIEIVPKDDENSDSEESSSESDEATETEEVSETNDTIEVEETKNEISEETPEQLPTEIEYSFLDYTEFSEYWYDGVFRCGTDFESGDYYILPLYGAGALYEVSDSPDDFTWSYYRLLRKVSVDEGQYVNVSDDGIMVHADEVDMENWSKYGVFLVGKDIAEGEYKMETITDEYNTALGNITGIHGAYQLNESDINAEPLESDYLFDSQKYITLKDGQYITISNIRLTNVNSAKKSEEKPKQKAVRKTVRLPTSQLRYQQKMVIMR